MKKKIKILGASGVGVVLFGILLKFVIIPAIVKSQVEETIALRPGTEAFQRWRKLPVTMLLKVYLYEVMNPSGIIEKGELPIVKERGPFIYLENREKTNICVDEKNDTARYMQKANIRFAKDISPESEDTELLLPNFAAIAFAQIAESIPGMREYLHLFNMVIEKMWPNGVIFIKVKVSDYLFNGVELNCRYKQGETAIEKLIWQAMCRAFAYVRPKRTVVLDNGEPGRHTFACFHYKQNMLDGPYTVKLGIDEPERIGEITSWRRKNDLDGMWGSKKCNRLFGTDSTVFRPFLHDVDTLSVFNSDICRMADLTFEEEHNFMGVPTRRYVLGVKTFASVLEHSENYCYCPRSVIGLTGKSGCLHTGLLDLSSCQGAPIYVSNPHFHMADPIYRYSVHGMNPNSSRHVTFIDIEPYTGYPMRGAMRAQLSGLLKSVPQVDSMKNFPNVLLPVIWIDEGVELTEELVDEVKSRLLNMLLIADIATWVIIAIGIVLIITSIALCVYHSKSS